MEWVVVGVILFIVLFALMILGVPVGYSMICTAALYLLYRWGLSGAELMVSNAFDAAGNYLLLAAPLFILMGECIAASGLGKGAFRVVDSWLGWVPGSLGVSCIATGTLFGAATGFSATGIAALGPVVLPEVQARGYAPDLGMGALG